MMRLSIIIPVYNVAEYIEKCVYSLLKQDIPTEEYEIIIINDGSPDNSREVVMDLMKTVSNIVFIDQENGGVSMARNAGIGKAKGEFILPVDPDDYVLPNTLRNNLEYAEKNNLDVLYLSFEILNTAGKPVWHTDYAIQEKQVYRGVEGYFAGRGKGIRDPDRSWAILYRKAMLDQFGITYPKDVAYLEDGIFLAKIFAVAHQAGFSNRPFYQRTTRPGSATNSDLFFSEKAVSGFLQGITNLENFEAAQHVNQSGKLLLNHVKAKFLILPLGSCIGSNKKTEYKKLVTRLKELGHKKINTEGLRLGYKTLATVYNFSPALFYYFFPVSQKMKHLIA